MNALQCNSCGATLLPETSFCRQCGAPVSGNLRAPVAEYPNAPFRGGSENVTTQRLGARLTNDQGGRQFQAPYAPTPLAAVTQTRSKATPLVLGTVALIAVLLGIITIVAVVRLRTPTRIVKFVGKGATAQGELAYPGAEMLLNVTGPDGVRVMKLRTSDSLDLVQHFYETALQTTKTVEVSNSLVVIKNDKVTATLIAEGDNTNILIKQVP